MPYADVMAEKAAKEAGIQADQWAMCTALNTTYVDCPIQSDFEGEFVVAAQNPAAVTQPIMRLKLPFADYKTEVLNLSTKEWQKTDSSLLCFDYQENTIKAETTTTCELFVKASIPAQSQGYLRLTKSLAAKEHAEIRSKVDTS